MLNKGNANFSWRELVSDKPLTDADRRSFIEFRPVLDYNALQPGKEATDAIRQAARDLNFAGEYGARVRLTGPVPIANEEYATVQDGALVNGIGTVVVVLFILWMALHSPKIILAVFINLFIGLSITTALGLWMVGSLNLLSIAFAVLFVGLGVDFGIQYSVRYRSERFKTNDLTTALLQGAERSAVPLSLAAMATSAGFLSFLPTDYKGISELGEIAGVGMLVAFTSSITVLPALLKLLNPPGEMEPVGYAFLAPVDRFLEKHRVIIVVGTLLVALAGTPLLYFLHFDFNPINLRSPKVESIATFLDLRKDPNTGANAVNVMTNSDADAKKIADKLEKLPEVLSVRWLESFVPEDQPAKLRLIAQGAKILDPALNPDSIDPAPSDQENIDSLKESAESLRKAAGDATGPGAVASRRLADALSKLAESDEATRNKAQAIFVEPLKVVLDGLKKSLQAEPVSLKTLPPDLVKTWKTKDGLQRVEALPRGDPNDNDTLRKFATAVLAAEPTAIGGPVSILKSGDLVVRAFIEAGVCALVVISLLLWLTLRRITDVLLTLVPLLVAGAVTLGNLRADRDAAQFRQHRRAAAAARHRRRVQDLLCDGMALGPNQPSAVEPDARDFLQRDDHGDRVRQPVAIQSSRYLEHGQAAGAVAIDDARRGVAVSARPNGQTPRCRGVGRCRRPDRRRPALVRPSVRRNSPIQSSAALRSLKRRSSALAWASWLNPSPCCWRGSRESDLRRGSRFRRRRGSPARSLESPYGRHQPARWSSCSTARPWRYRLGLPIHRRRASASCRSGSAFRVTACSVLRHRDCARRGRPASAPRRPRPRCFHCTVQPGYWRPRRPPASRPWGRAQARARAPSPKICRNILLCAWSYVGSATWLEPVLK